MTILNAVESSSSSGLTQLLTALSIIIGQNQHKIEAKVDEFVDSKIYPIFLNFNSVTRAFKVSLGSSQKNQNWKWNKWQLVDN